MHSFFIKPLKESSCTDDPSVIAELCGGNHRHSALPRTEAMNSDIFASGDKNALNLTANDAAQQNALRRKGVYRIGKLAAAAD